MERWLNEFTAIAEKCMPYILFVSMQMLDVEFIKGLSSHARHSSTEFFKTISGNYVFF